MRKLEIQFEINSQCKLNCIHCSSESDSEQSTQQLSPEKIADFISEVDKEVKIYICLTGGEPLLSNRFFPILSILHRFNNIDQIGFFTSGCIVTDRGNTQAINKRLSMRLKEAGITFCYVSVYSHLSNVHDSVTRILHSHECAIHSIRNLLDTGIEARVNFVPMKYNQKDIEETVYFLDDIGVKEIRFLRLVRHGRAREHWEMIGLSKEKQEYILQTAIDNVSRNNLLIKVTVAGFPQRWDCRPFGTGRMCQAGIRLYYVDWKGSVFPCACRKREKVSRLFGLDDHDVSGKLLFLPKSHNLRCLQDI